jgi:hypothetical protein
MIRFPATSGFPYFVLQIIYHAKYFKFQSISPEISRHAAVAHALKLAAQLHVPEGNFISCLSGAVNDRFACCSLFSYLMRHNSKKTVQRHWSTFAVAIENECAPGCFLETYNEYNLLINGVDGVCTSTNSQLVVMGISGGGALAEKINWQ